MAPWNSKEKFKNLRPHRFMKNIYLDMQMTFEQVNARDGAPGLHTQMLTVHAGVYFWVCKLRDWNFILFYFIGTK